MTSAMYTFMDIKSHQNISLQWHYMSTMMVQNHQQLYACLTVRSGWSSVGKKSAQFYWFFAWRMDFDWWFPLSIMRKVPPCHDSLLRRHNGQDGASNHQPHACLLKRSFRRRSKKTSKLRVSGLCVGNSPVTGEFPAQMASNGENVSIWWRHHASLTFRARLHIKIRIIEGEGSVQLGLGPGFLRQIYNKIYFKPKRFFSKMVPPPAIRKPGLKVLAHMDFNVYSYQ